MLSQCKDTITHHWRSKKQTRNQIFTTLGSCSSYQGFSSTAGTETSSCQIKWIAVHFLVTYQYETLKKQPHRLYSPASLLCTIREFSCSTFTDFLTYFFIKSYSHLPLAQIPNSKSNTITKSDLPFIN